MHSRSRSLPCRPGAEDCCVAPSRARAFSVVFARLLLVLALAACGNGGGQGTSADGVWAADFDLAREAATTEFEREALQDNEVSRAEYEEAVGRYVKCLNDGGLAAKAIPAADGSYYNYEVAGETDDDLMTSCALGTTRQIESLYVGQLTNPNQIDASELMVQCFRDRGLIGDDYSVDEYKALGTVVDSDGFVTAGTGSLPFDDTDPRFLLCLSNPSKR